MDKRTNYAFLAFLAWMAMLMVISLLSSCSVAEPCPAYQ